MNRVVVPELLDHLPPEAPAARQSRRDLVWINRCLGSTRWFRRELARRLGPGDRVLELGAGESRLHRLAPPAMRWDAVDLAPRPPHWPAPARWHRTDLRAFDHWHEYNVVVGNLIFHHLTAPELAAVGAQLRPHARLLLAHEPTRSARAQRAFALLCRVIRADPVTRHDGHVSIAAGFRGGELAQALGLSAPDWRWRATRSLTGTLRLAAWRDT